jgi:uncharacterized protein (TIGR02246 family)
MKPLAVALLSLLALPAHAADTPAGALIAWQEAYATNDGAKAAATYTENATLWGSTSREITVGRAAITDYFGRRRPGAVAISVTFGAHELRQVTPDVAVAIGHYTFVRTRADGSTQPEPSRFSMTLVRETSVGWKIASHHSSRLPPPAQ